VLKPRTALTGMDSDIECPEFVTQLDYEVELAMIMGKTCKNISQEQAKDAIFGYMIFNDVSARDIQFKDKQFTRGKGFDTFAPCGPWITTSDDVPDPQNLKLVTKVNGQIRQNSSTEKMFIKIPEIVSKISNVMTLEKGDIISTGTPAGVMLNKPNAVFLKDGDTVEMEIENLELQTVAKEKRENFYKKQIDDYEKKFETQAKINKELREAIASLEKKSSKEKKKIPKASTKKRKT